MEKRYQVFVSSTYEDLQSERQEVMQALLELDCIPAGMELFPAANEDQWSLIRKVIEDCDYYIVVVGGRYGSIGSKGISYTEMEYRYAEKMKKPIIAFLHKDPDSLPAKKTERNDQGMKKLSEFKKYVEHRMCKYWTSPKDLGSVVSRSLIQLIKNSPAIGWVRADNVDSKSIIENVKLKEKISELEAQLVLNQDSNILEIENIAQDEDSIIFELELEVEKENPIENDNNNSKRIHREYSFTVNEISGIVLPLIYHSTYFGRYTFGDGLQNLMKDKEDTVFTFEGTRYKITKVYIDEPTIAKIFAHFSALKLINSSPYRNSVRWNLTARGEMVMHKVATFKK